LGECGQRLYDGLHNPPNRETHAPDARLPVHLTRISGNSIKALHHHIFSYVPPKDWSTAWHAGARKIVREEHRV
jgi:hypothetical protein